MSVSDLIKNTLAVAAIGAVSAGVLAVGTVLTRRTDITGRALRTLSTGAHRIGSAVVDAGNELGTLWSELGTELEHELRKRTQASARRARPTAAGRAAATTATAKPEPRAGSKRKRATTKATGRSRKPTAASGANGQDRRRNTRTRPH